MLWVASDKLNGELEKSVTVRFVAIVNDGCIVHHLECRWWSGGVVDLSTAIGRTRALRWQSGFSDLDLTLNIPTQHCPPCRC